LFCIRRCAIAQQVYTDIGKLLAHYTSGKLPKAFKVVPSLHNWEEVLYLTRPDKWTPQAMYAATRIFASNLNPKMAQRFYNLVLLDAVRADVHANRKLNYHYYVALKKAVYKPAAFFKGILLPLCTEGSDCTLREAVIISSVLQKVSIPVHHSAVALHKLATMRGYNGATSIFMRTLLDKKYSLPAPVIDSLVAHFARFKDDGNDDDDADGGGGGVRAALQGPHKRIGEGEIARSDEGALPSQDHRGGAEGAIRERRLEGGADDRRRGGRTAAAGGCERRRCHGRVVMVYVCAWWRHVPCPPELAVGAASIP